MENIPTRKIQIIGGLPQSDWNQTDETKNDYIKNKPEFGLLASLDEVAKDFLASDVQESLNKVDSVASTYETKADSQAKLDESKEYTNTIASGKSDTTHDHNADYDAKGSADSALESAKSYTDSAVSNLASTSSVDTKIATHNTATDAHNDIRLLVEGLTTRLNTLADSDDTTLDQMSEIVAYIKSNKELIEAVTTNKVNVSDIINNLTTNVADKPLSAAQGVVLKALIDAITVPTKTSELTNDSGFLTSYTETDPTVPAWAKAASKPTYTASEVGADASGSASVVQTNLDTHASNKSNPHGVTLSQLGLTADATELNYMDGVTSAVQAQLDAKAAQTSLDTHTSNKSNPHGVTLSQLGVNATATELNYVDGVTSNIQTQLNGKLGDYTIEIYNGTGGNPKPVRFASFNYSTCGSENGIAAKISLVSGHGNGTSYAFLEDAIIRVNHLGDVSVDNFKYYGADAGSYDEANRQYGDIFWLHDTTNKIVDFYVLMGQYARVYQTPWKRLTYSTGGTVTQHTSCTVYSSGDKVWANNSDIALTSDIPTTAAQIGAPTVAEMNAAIANKSDTGHKHTKSEITDFPSSMTPTSHNQAASTITAGTFAGQVVANSSGQTASVSLLRNSKLVNAETNPTVNGEICWTYE